MAGLKPEHRVRMPHVYISVLNWNNYEQTIDCLRQLEKIDYDPVTIIVVDNASPNDSVARIREAFPSIRLIEAKENLGYAAGHRHTVEIALEESAELIWIVNTDIKFQPDVLEKLVSAYLRLGNAVYGSIILNEENPNIVGMNAYGLALHGLPTLDKKIVRSRVPYNVQFPTSDILRVGNVSGCSFLLPLEIVKSHGFMDESFFMYAEELDYCFRLTYQGIVNYLVPNSCVIHKNRATTKENDHLTAIMNYYDARNTLVVYRRLYGWRKYLRSITTRRRLQFYLVTVFKTIFHRSRSPNTDCYKLLAIRDSLIGRMGKTIAPEAFWDDTAEIHEPSSINTHEDQS